MSKSLNIAANRARYEARRLKWCAGINIKMTREQKEKLNEMKPKDQSWAEFLGVERLLGEKVGR